MSTREINLAIRGLTAQADYYRKTVKLYDASNKHENYISLDGIKWFGTEEELLEHYWETLRTPELENING